MKRITTTLAALAVMSVGVTACGTDNDHHADAEAAKDKAATQTQQEQTEPTEADKRDVYLTYLRSEYPDQTTGVPDRMLLKLGHLNCDGFDTGLTAVDILTAGIETGADPEFVGAVLGSSVAAFCPEYTDNVMALSGAGEVA